MASEPLGERSNLFSKILKRKDCFVASLLAMTFNFIYINILGRLYRLLHKRQPSQ